MAEATLLPSRQSVQRSFAGNIFFTRPSAYILCAVGLIIMSVALRRLEWVASNNVHAVLDIVPSVLALVIGVLGYTRFLWKKNTTFLCIAVGFLGTGILDGYHALVTFGLIGHNSPNILPWSWNATRWFLSVAMCLSMLAHWKKEKVGTARNFESINRLVYFLGIAGVAGSILILTFVELPPAYYPEYFLPRPGEIFAALFFLLALVGFLKRGKWKTKSLNHWIVFSLILGLAAQLDFMTFSTQMLDTAFNIAHLLKISSYLCVFTGFLVSISKIYRNSEIANNALQYEVTARKMTEIRLSENVKKLANLNYELEQFAYIASHDLQEPLRKVQAFGERLSAKYGEALGEQGCDYINRMSNATERMQNLIADLLSFSRVSSKGAELTTVDLNEIVATVLSDLSMRISDTNAQIRIDTLPIVSADPTQMQQLFQNIIGNALKYCRDGTRPVIHVGVSGEIRDGEHATNLPSGYCVLAVRDNGIGFEQKHAARIFRVFERLHGRGAYSGTGIGLAICKKIIGRHGGEIWAESAPDQGTTFFMSLPQRAPSREELRDAA